LKADIYYFSGTGNSLHVAKELARGLSGTRLHPIVPLLDGSSVKPDSEVLGIVFPVYTYTVPYQVRRFLQKLDVSKAKYIFAVSTNGGVDDPAMIRLYIKKVLGKKRRELDSHFDIKMIINSPTGIIPSFFPGDKKWTERISEERLNELESALEKELDQMIKIITERRKYPLIEKERTWHVLKEKVVSRMGGGTGREIAFFVDDTCTRCGICEGVCLSGKVEMKEEGPIWKKKVNCFYCYACFNFCPTQSILVKNYREKNGRYHHPDVSAEEIANQRSLK
jgi:NAD-dependent dihydropyrimidine dehydrogenase PreA subunit